MRAPVGSARVEACGGRRARRTNYGFEKRQRELKKKKKNEEKAEQRKRQAETNPDQEKGEDAPDKGSLGPGLPDRD